MVREQLVDLTGHDAPPGGEVRVLETPDGFFIRAARWTVPVGAARGTVILFSGYNEFIEKYYEVISDLLDRGFAVVTLDWRGQGLSSRLITDAQKAYVGHFDDFLNDARMVISDLAGPDMPRPLHLVGHSMGGHLGLRLLEEDPDLFERAVLCAPMTGIALPLPGWFMRSIAGLHNGIGLGRRYVWGSGPLTEKNFQFDRNPVTSDQGRWESATTLVRAQPLFWLGGLTWRWLQEALRSIDTSMASSNVSRVSSPVLVTSAGREKLVCVSSHKRLADMSEHVTLVSFPEAMHEILMETDTIRTQFWAAFDQFMDK
jgi:lysophospholipase